MKMEKQWYQKHRPTAIDYFDPEQAKINGTLLAKCAGILARVCDTFGLTPEDPTTENRIEAIEQFLNNKAKETRNEREQSER